MSPTTATCSCGGRFNLDVQYLFDARRFSLLGHVPILWRCAVCGRSLVEGQPATTAEVGTQESGHAGGGKPRRPRRDHCGEVLLDSLGVRPERRGSALGTPIRVRR